MSPEAARPTWRPASPSWIICFPCSRRTHRSTSRWRSSRRAPRRRSPRRRARSAKRSRSRCASTARADLSEARVGGLATDLAARFLNQLAESAGATLHVRLIEGSDTQHVLEAIFKALGVALAQAMRPRRRAA
ncbi:MAG: hypothetical protein E6G13_08795 [Actinobacteria bacterium]|nr:MAG: hypothetical protein E6G13_08795 [Actinomycetota bacterium]